MACGGGSYESSVTAPPPAPSGLVVDIGLDQTVILADTINLNAAVTKDDLPLQEIVTYGWSQISDSGIANFSSPTAKDTLVTFTEVGSYVLKLIVITDNEIVNDTINITVNLKAASVSDLISRPTT